MSGWNNILITLDDDDSQIIDDIAPVNDEIVVTKTTDSALTGTNLRLILNNLGIKNVVCVGIFTDQCVASTVRSLSDESFNVVVLEDACAAVLWNYTMLSLQLSTIFMQRYVQLTI